MATTPGSLRALRPPAGRDVVGDPLDARADDRFDAVRHAVVAVSRDLGVQVDIWGPGDGTDGWAVDDDGDADAVAMLRAPGHPGNGLVVHGHTVADTNERVLALLLSIRATGAFFAPHPSLIS